MRRSHSLLLLQWDPIPTGKPLLKYTVRVMAGNEVLFEKVAMKPHAVFRDETPDTLTVQVNAITSAGISQWSRPYVYDANRGFFRGSFIVDPAVSIEGVSPSDETAIVHVNVTAPGTLLCSIYAPNRRPVFSRQEVTSAGAAGVLAGELAGTAGKALSRCLDDRLVEGAGVVEILAGNLAGNEVDGAIALLAQIVETCPLSRHLVETKTVASSLLRCVIANPRGEFVPSAVKLLVRIQQGSHGSSSSS